MIRALQKFQPEMQADGIMDLAFIHLAEKFSYFSEDIVSTK